MSKLVISTSSFDTAHNPAIQKLIKAGMEIVGNPHKRKLTEAEVTGLLGTNTIGMIAGVEPLTRNVLAAATSMKVISRCGAGMDTVDLAAAAERDITVSNTPEAPAQSVAELTIGLILSALRRVQQTDRLLRKGEWPRLQGQLLAAQTVGIIGLGHIGKRVARLCQAFEARVIACDPGLTPQNLSSLPAELVSLDTLLAESDIITLHLPYSKESHHLLDSHAFEHMRPGVIVINAARGGLIDEVALCQALTDGKIGVAALDVFENEPYNGPLLACDNIILTSHIGSLAKESRLRMDIEAAETLLRGLIKAGLRKDE